MWRRSRFEYILSKKSETLQSLSYFNGSALKSARSTLLFSAERLSRRFLKQWLFGY